MTVDSSVATDEFSVAGIMVCTGWGGKPTGFCVNDGWVSSGEGERLEGERGLH